MTEHSLPFSESRSQKRTPRQQDGGMVVTIGKHERVKMHGHPKVEDVMSSKFAVLMAIERMAKTTRSS